MNNGYVSDLYEALGNTGFYYGTVREKDYDSGIKLLLDTFMRHKAEQSRVFFVGNGGSAAIASHMTADFMKNGRMITVGLYDQAVITCMGNDYGYEHVFSKQLEYLAGEGDLLVAVSSSGNSMNIVNAIKSAKAVGAEVVTFTGFDEKNRCSQMGDVNVYVPRCEYGKVETIHTLILQQIADLMTEGR